MNALRESRGDRIFSAANLCLVCLFTLLVLYPLVYVLSCSISDPTLVGSGAVWLWPRGITFEGYARVFRDENIMTGYANSLFYTVFGTAINMVLTLMAGYALSKPTLPGRSLIMTYMFITMYFSGGLIPSYLNVKALGLLDTRMILLIGSAVGVYNVIIARTFFQGVPKELEEAATIDGCGTVRTFVQIVLPVSRALAGVLTLYYAVGHWNSYFSAMIYISDPSKQPLQVFLRQILITEQTSAAMTKGISAELQVELEKMKHLLKYAVIIVSSLPVLILYPFVQKYFDKGVLIGSLKG